MVELDKASTQGATPMYEDQEGRTGRCWFDDCDLVIVIVYEGTSRCFE